MPFRVKLKEDDNDFIVDAHTYTNDGEFYIFKDHEGSEVHRELMDDVEYIEREI